MRCRWFLRWGPRANGGWAQEISLDLDMVSAACPNCHILLVEASSSSLTNLGTAVTEAAKLGATEISNSYGGNESSSDTSYYHHPGIAITVSSGDGGYGVEYPAASQYVTAVGAPASPTQAPPAAGTKRSGRRRQPRARGRAARPTYFVPPDWLTLRKQPLAVVHAGRANWLR